MTKKTKKTPLSIQQREKILYSVLISLADKADKQVMPQLAKAINDTYHDFYKKVFKTTEEDKAFHVLAKRGLIPTVSTIRLYDIMPNVDEVIGDSVGQFRFATRSGKPNSDRLAGFSIGYNGLCKFSSGTYIKLPKEWPSTLTTKIQFEDDSLESLRQKARDRIMDSLEDYKEFTTVAVQVRGIIMTSKYAEDLISDLPDIESLVLQVVTPKINPPAVIDPAVGKILSSLKPIESV